MDKQVEHWRAVLDKCVTAPAPVTAEWAHGVPATADQAAHAHVVFELGGEAQHSGGEARWAMSTTQVVGDDGCIVGWEARAEAMAALYDCDEEGYVTRATGMSHERVKEDELHELPVVVQLIARARWRLGDVPVTDEPPVKDNKSSQTHVNLQAVRIALLHAARLQCQYDPTHAVATDGTKVTKAGANGEYTVIARGAVVHDGSTLGGTLKEEDSFLGEHRTTYIAEKAATDDVLYTLPEGSRVVLWLDSISPQQALHRFRRSPARRKRQFHMAGRHCASARLLERHEVVVYHWQMSHVGEPANEWADREAAARADAEEPRELVEAEYSFTTALLPRDTCSTRSWAVRRADLWVACRLRAQFTQCDLRGAEGRKTPARRAARGDGRPGSAQRAVFHIGRREIG